MSKNEAEGLASVDAKTPGQITALPRDNEASGDFWWSMDERTFTICEQKLEEDVSQKVVIPRDVFEKISRWYLTGKKTKQRSRT